MANFSVCFGDQTKLQVPHSEYEEWTTGQRKSMNFRGIKET